MQQSVNNVTLDFQQMVKTNRHIVLRAHLTLTETMLHRHTPGDFFLRSGGSGGIGEFKNPPLFLNSVSRGGGKSGGKGVFLKNIYKYPPVSEIALKIELQSAF